MVLTRDLLLTLPAARPSLRCTQHSASTHGWVLPCPVWGFLLLPFCSNLGNDIFPFRKGNFLEGLLSCPLLPLRRGLYFILPSKSPLAHATQFAAPGWHQPQVPLCKGKARRGAVLRSPPPCLAHPGMLAVPKDSCWEEPSLCFPCLLPRSSPFPQPCQLQLGGGQCWVLSGCLRAPNTTGVLLWGAPLACRPPAYPGSQAGMHICRHGLAGR